MLLGGPEAVNGAGADAGTETGADTGAGAGGVFELC